MESWRSFQTAGNPLTCRSVGSFGISEVNITGRKKAKPTEYFPNRNSQRRSSPDVRVHQQRAGAGQGGSGCRLRVKTGPECPEDNLRELMWDSHPNCGVAREEQNKNKTEKFPVKGSNLKHSLACSENKGLSKYQRRVSSHGIPGKPSGQDQGDD